MRCLFAALILAPQAILARFCPGDKPIPGFIAKWVLSRPQSKNENEQRKMRKQFMKQDRQLRRTLAFSGKLE